MDQHPNQSSATPGLKETRDELASCMNTLITMFQKQYRQMAAGKLEYPPFNYNTTFAEWATLFAKQAVVRLGLTEPELIEECTKHLDGLVGAIATFVAKEEKTDWKKFVAAVDRHLIGNVTSHNPRKSSLRQSECPREDFDIYVFNKLRALEDELPKSDQRTLVYQLLTGLNDEYHNHLLQKSLKTKSKR